MIPRHVTLILKQMCFWALFAACANAHGDAPPPPPACLPQKSVSAASLRLSEAANAAASTKQVTFYGDLLPVLSSNVRGKIYKCTTCHAHYGTPDGLNSVSEIDSIVNSLTIGRMPRNGDRVPADTIALFKTWQLQGFQAGVANLNPTPGPTGSDAVDGNSSKDPTCR